MGMNQISIFLLYHFMSSLRAANNLILLIYYTHTHREREREGERERGLFFREKEVPALFIGNKAQGSSLLCSSAS